MSISPTSAPAGAGGEVKISKIFINSFQGCAGNEDKSFMKMEIRDRGRFALAMLRDRLDTILGRIDVGNGTPVATALADALAVDLRLRAVGDDVQELLAITDEQLLNAASKLTWALEVKHAKFVLPLGTNVVSKEVGSIEIGGETWALDADHPGLHPLETISRFAGGANLQLLRREIRRLTRRLACARIGLPSPHQIGGYDLRHLLQFPPYDDAGGVVLQRSAYDSGAASFRSALPAQISAMAERMVADMRALWKRRAEIADRVEAARALALASAAENGCRLHAIAISMDLSSDAEGPVGLYVEYEGLDDALRPGLVLDYVPGGRFEESPRVIGVPHSWRKDDLEELAALGADGRIDDIARGIVMAAPEGSAAVLARLAADLETPVTFPVGNGMLHATVFWHHGCLSAEFSFAGRLSLFQDTVEVTGVQLPETVVIEAAGRRLDELIELPFPCEATIDNINNLGTFVRLKISAAEWLIDTKTGRIWPEVED